MRPVVCTELVKAEHALDLGPVAMARALGVSYGTYKNWRSVRTSMPAVATRCLELLLAHPSATRKLAGDRQPHLNVTGIGVTKVKIDKL